MIKHLISLVFLLISSMAYGALTDIKFGRYQIADSQWNVNACLYTTTCQIYSKQPGTAYKIPWTSGQIQWSNGDYIKFELSGNASYPYLAKQYDSAGNVKAVMGTGKIVNMGPDYFFFVGNDNNTGQLFSGSSGMSNTNGVSWTGTLNPTTQQADAYADSNYSVDPLSSGQTATNTPNSGGGGGAPAWPASSGITVTETTQKNSSQSRVNSLILGNSIYIEEKIGSSGNSVTIEQTGSYNKISGLAGTTDSIIDGDNNIINIKQGDTLGKNLIEFNVVGNTNNITVWQARNPTTGLQDGSESGGHYLGFNVNGNSNSLNLKQSNHGGLTSGHFAYVDISGNTNSATLKQTGNGSKTFFGIVNGNSNIFDVFQQGDGSYLSLSLTGNGHNVTANQKDAGSHNATINLTNAGGATTVNLIQQGTAAQTINITQQCATLSGCSVTVTQGSP
jgi:hypothetical protein